MQQHMAALQRANEVRLERARLRREVDGGKLDLAEVILDPPDVCLKVAIVDLLEWAPGVGPRSSSRLLVDHLGDKIAGPSIPLGRLGMATRLQIVARLRERALRRAA